MMTQQTMTQQMNTKLSKTIKKAASFIATSALIAAIASISPLALISNAAQAAELTVNINEISTPVGHLQVALFLGEDAYHQGKTKWSSKKKVNHESEQLVFSDLPDGDYAIKIFHDANDNNKMDFNMLGMPKENYGFSNNAGRFGQPEYEEAKFTVKDNTVITIDLF